MKLFFSLAALLILANSILSGQEMKNEPVTVKYVDIKRYVGLWYEIAKIPNRFQRDCTGGTTAEYSLNEDGRIKVVNSCNQEDGNRKSTEGVAKVVDKATNSKLEVSFFNLLGIRPFWGDYWIIGLDKNYEYAVIGSPDRKYGWILSRTKKLSEARLQEAFDILKQQGYNKKDFEFTKQE